MLKRLKNVLKNTEVHFTDYAEFMSLYKFKPLSAANSVLFSIWRFNEIKTYDKNLNHVCDREPISGYIYQLVFSDATLDEIEEHFIKFKDLNLNNDWFSFILVIKEGAEDEALEKMIKRNNGIDIIDIKYIKRQNEIFRLWAKIMGYPIFEVDFSNDFDEEQNNIINLITSWVEHGV